MDTTGVIELIILAVLILLSAFFSSAETALSSIGRAKIRALEEEGKKHAKTLSKVLENYDRMLSTILVGNNIVNLSASALATALTIRIWGNVYISAATGILTLLVLVFGEIVPKTAARHNAEKTALSFSVPIRFLMTVLYPIVFVIDHIAGFVLKLFGQTKDSSGTITESELRSYVDVSHEDGIIESDERKIINNVFDFSDSVAKDIMIPRIDMSSIPEDATYKEVMMVFRETMFTRIPVYREEKANIIGFPLGYSVTRAKVTEAVCAIEDGALEVDMVININDAKNGDFDKILNEIKEIKSACGDHILKVIIETCYLTDEEKIRLCKVVTEAGADYIKTSTGFGTGGATFEDVKLFKENIGPDVKIKAAGGIRTRDDMERFMELGADRLGTSSAISILEG